EGEEDRRAYDGSGDERRRLRRRQFRHRRDRQEGDLGAGRAPFFRMGPAAERYRDGLHRARQLRAGECLDLPLARPYLRGRDRCEVEIDGETGKLGMTRYSAVDDVGTVLNPLICEGQIQGGIVQGLGQALCEDIVYDASGQLLSGSFMDYCMPRADDLCDFAL